MKTFGKVVFIAAIGVAASTQAAQDGLLGSTSSGESEITVTKEDSVQITGVGDLDLGSFTSTTNALTVSDALCIFNSTANYQVTVTSDNGQFALEDATGVNSIPYAMTWADSSAVPNPVTHGSALSNLSGDQTSPNCSGTSNANFSVTIAAADFNSAEPGVYTDILTLMIEPE